MVAVPLLRHHKEWRIATAGDLSHPLLALCVWTDNNGLAIRVANSVTEYTFVDPL